MLALSPASTPSSSSSTAYPSPPSQQTTQQPHSPSLPSSTSSPSYLSQELTNNNNKYPPPSRHAPSPAASVLSPPLNLSFLGPNAVFYQPQNFAAFCYICKSTLLSKLKSGVVLRVSPEARLFEDLCQSCQVEWSQAEHSTEMSSSMYAVDRLPTAASLSSTKPRILQPNLLHDVFFSAAPKIESFDMVDVNTPLSTVDLYSSSAPPSSPACFSSSATATNSPRMTISPSPSYSSLSSVSYGNIEGACKILNTVGLGMNGVSFGIDEFSSTASNASASSPPKTQISPPLSPNVYLFDDSETLFGLDFSDACRVDAFSDDANTTTHDHYLAAVAAAGEFMGSRQPKSHSKSDFPSSEPYGWFENTHRSEEPFNYFQDVRTVHAFSPPPPPPNGPPPMIASCDPYAPFNSHGGMERHRMSSPQLFSQAPSMPSPYSSSFPSNPTTVSLDAISPRVDTGCFGVPTCWNDGSLVDPTTKAKRKTKDEQEMAARTSRVQRQQGERRRTLDYQTPRPFSRRMTEVSDTLITFRKSSSFANSLPPVESGRRGSHIRKRRCSGLELPTTLDYSEEDESEDGMYEQGDSADETYVASRHLVGVIDTDAEDEPVGIQDVSEVESGVDHVESAESSESSDSSDGETVHEEENEEEDEEEEDGDNDDDDDDAERRDRVAGLTQVKRTLSSGTTGIVSTRPSSSSSSGGVTSMRRKSRIALGQENEPVTNKQSQLYKSTNTTTTTTTTTKTEKLSSPVDDPELSPVPSTSAALAAAREAGCGDLNSPRGTCRPTVFESLTASQIDWCRYCGTTEGVNWRPGPWGKRTLCNKHGCDYKGYGFACKLPRLDLTAYTREKIDERERPVLQLFCTTCHDPDSYVSNTLVRCEGCPRAYHRLCYDGLCTLPDEKSDPASIKPWFCSHTCSDNARRRRIVVELPRRKLPLMSTPKASDAIHLGMGSRNRNGGR